MSSSNIQLSIVYASQTGQAEAISNEVYENVIKLGLIAEKLTLNDYTNKLQIDNDNNNKIAIVIVSTTGDGEPPENGIKFWRKIYSTFFKNIKYLRYCLLGLGDSNYTSFCNFGKLLDEQLQKLGAKPFMKSYFADDAVGLETIVEPWTDNLIKILPDVIRNGCKDIKDVFVNSVTTVLDKIKIDDKLYIDEEWDIDSNIESVVNGRLLLKESDLTIPLISPEFLQIKKLINDDDYDRLTSISQNNVIPNLIDGSIMTCPIVNASQLTSVDAVKLVIMITTELPEPIHFEPGDSFGFFCQNESLEVENLLHRLEIKNFNEVIELSIIEGTTKRRAMVPNFIPKISTPKDILTYCCDIHCPSKALIRTMADLARNSKQKRRLQELCSRQGNDEFMKFVRMQSLSVLDLLNHFSSVKISFQRLVEHLPRLMPRPYSVCNIPNSDKTVKFTFSVINLSAENGRLRKRDGVFTGWMERLTRAMRSGRKQSFNVRIFKRKSTSFKLPIQINKPLIFIGPGTGIAPFLSFLEFLEKTDNQILCFLFFGCRHKNKDFIFKEELLCFLETKVISELFLAFSREDKKQYVQDKILENAEKFLDLILNQMAMIYVCGDAKNMSKDVNTAFINVLKTSPDFDEDSASKYLMQMRLHHRYHEDVW